MDCAGTINHNFDETMFIWLWAKYVKKGNVEKHCTASIPSIYSKKFSLNSKGTWGSDGIKRNKHANGKLLKGKVVQNMPVEVGM